MYKSDWLAREEQCRDLDDQDEARPQGWMISMVVMSEMLVERSTALVAVRATIVCLLCEPVSL